ncbi:MAG TPA: DUF4430 domain-containing protein [Solirubrobacteraceae bacterium]|nr:DUF4430 domain-containing protein [Solirubrobacteraceae bacterium]
MFALPPLALAAAGALAGCGLGPGKTPTGVQLQVTREFGAQPMRSLAAPQAHGQETVMSLLMRNATVATRYGGGFVQSIDGRSGGFRGSQPTAWFYYVNGVQAPKGAAETNVLPGDRIWWDLHDWSQTEEVAAVVGSFPEPFVNGIEGRRPPVRLECAAPEATPCRTVAARLRAVGVNAGLAALAPGGEAPETLRLLVGTWQQLRNDPGADQLEHGPGASGVYARVLGGGRSFALLDAQGQVTRTLSGSAGLVAATRYTGEDPEWLITGTDTAGLELAAHAVRESTLHDRFAIALLPGAAGASSVLPLPQPAP